MIVKVNGVDLGLDPQTAAGMFKKLAKSGVVTFDDGTSIESNLEGVCEKVMSETQPDSGPVPLTIGDYVFEVTYSEAKAALPEPAPEDPLPGLLDAAKEDIKAAVENDADAIKQQLSKIETLVRAVMVVASCK